MCQAVCTNTPNISPPCQNEGHQYTLSVIQELISSWKHQSKSSQERHFSFCQIEVFGEFFTLECSPICAARKIAGKIVTGAQKFTSQDNLLKERGWENKILVKHIL